MAKKRSASAKVTNVKVGNISLVSGTVNIAGGNVTLHQITTGLGAAEIKQLFDQLYTAIDANASKSIPCG